MKKRYGETVKQDALSRIATGESVGAVAKAMGISASNIYAWLAKEKNKPQNTQKLNKPAATEGLSKLSQGVAALAGDAVALQGEVRRLKNALKRAEEERDILKKATAYFATQTI
jgi:transposase